MLRIRMLVALIAVACLAAPAWAQPLPPPATRPAPAPLADKLPADCLFYVGWVGADAAAPAVKGTKLGDLLADPQVAPFISKTVAALEKALRDNLAEEDKDAAAIFDHVRTLLGRLWARPCALTVISLSPSDKPGPPDINIALLIDGGDQAEAIEAELNAFMDAVLPADLRETEKKIQIDISLVRQVSFDEDVPPLAWGRIGRHVLLAFGPTAAARIGESLAGDASKTLPANPRFAKTFARTGGGLSCSYIDLDGLLNKVAPAWVAKADGFEAEMFGMMLRVFRDGLGVGGVEAIASSLSVDGADLVSKDFCLMPGGKTGLFALADGPAVAEAALANVPADATFMIAATIDPARLFDELDKKVKSFPEAAEEWPAGLAAAEDFLGFKIRNDLLATLGGNVVVYNSPRAGGVLITGLTVVCDVKDPVKLRATLDKLAALLVREAPMRQRSRGREKGVAIESIEFKTARGVYPISYLRFAGLPVPVTPAWCVTDKHLVVSMFPQTLRAALLQIESGQENSILANAEFKALRAKLPPGGMCVNYTDDRAVMELLYPALPPLWQLACSYGHEVGIELDPTWLPARANLLRHMTGDAGVVINQPDGILAVSRGLLPSSSGSGLMVNVASRMMNWMMFASAPSHVDRFDVEAQPPQADPAPPEEDF